jgi:hypothetical protein
MTPTGYAVNAYSGIVPKCTKQATTYSQTAATRISMLPAKNSIKTLRNTAHPSTHHNPKDAT